MDFESLSIEELLRECAENPDGPAWTEFTRRFHRLIAKTVLRVCRDRFEKNLDVAQDIIQDVYRKLLSNDRALLKNFRSQHPNSFLGYLTTLTVNIACDHFRAIHAKKRDVENTVGFNEATLQEPRDGAKDVENQVLFRQMDEFLIQRGTGPSERRERAIFWLYYRQRLTAREIAELPGINLTVKGVESVIHRLTEYLRGKMND